MALFNEIEETTATSVSVSTTTYNVLDTAGATALILPIDGPVTLVDASANEYACIIHAVRDDDKVVLTLVGTA